MSASITAAFETIYAAELKLAFQRKGPQLKDFVRVQDASDGNALTFHKLGQGTATTKPRNGVITPMNTVSTSVTATPVDYFAAEYLDDLDEVKTSVNIRSGYIETSQMALGRQLDNVVLTAMDAATNVTSLVADLSPTIVTQTLEALRDNHADDGDLFFLIDNDMYTDIMADNAFASADFTNNRQYDTANKRFSFGGFDFLVFSGLPTSVTGATTYRNCFAGSKKAVGLAINSDIKTKVNYVAERDSWFVNSSMSVGSVIIENAGLIEVQIVS